MAAVDEFAGGHAGASADGRGILLLSLGDRGLFSGLEKRLWGGRAATGDGGAVHGVFGSLHDRGVACSLCFVYGSEMSGLTLRCRTRHGRMAISLLDREPTTSTQKAAVVGKHGRNDRELGRLLRTKARRTTGPEDTLDWYAAHAGLRTGLANLRPDPLTFDGRCVER